MVVGRGELVRGGYEQPQRPQYSTATLRALLAADIFLYTCLLFMHTAGSESPKKKREGGLPEESSLFCLVSPEDVFSNIAVAAFSRG